MFKLHIETDNDAFLKDARGEVASLLTKIADNLKEGGLGGIIRDSNGNSVGQWALDLSDQN